MKKDDYLKNVAADRLVTMALEANDKVAREHAAQELLRRCNLYLLKSERYERALRECRSIIEEQLDDF